MSGPHPIHVCLERVADEIGGPCKAAKITIADVNQSNGVIHVIDGVLLPN